MYEIGWIRLLSMIIGSATHSFEIMLSAFVFGLAAGGLWVRGRMDRFRRPEFVLGVVQLVMGIAAVATLPAYHWAVQSIGWLLVLHYWEQLTAAEAALALGIPEGTAKTRLRRGRQLLEAQLRALTTAPDLLSSTIGDLEEWARSLRGRLAPDAPDGAAR